MAVRFQTVQDQFVAYIRDPQNCPPPADVDPERMAIYRELFFNNIDSFLSNSFPVMRRILNDEQWYLLANTFYGKHPCQTPYFSGIAEEFLEFLTENKSLLVFPFQLELAHYEWCETALATAQSKPDYVDSSVLDRIENKLLRLSPVAWVLAYQYPVHRISAHFQPSEKHDKPTLLTVYRNQNDDVKFIEIAPLTYHLLKKFEPDSREVKEVVSELIQEVGNAVDNDLTCHAMVAVNQMIEKGILVEPF